MIREIAGLLPQLLTAVTTAGAALGGVCLTHHLTYWREQRAAAEKRTREFHSIATELIFILEVFAEACSEVAADSGDYNDDPMPVREPTVDYPELMLETVTGNCCLAA